MNIGINTLAKHLNVTNDSILHCATGVAVNAPTFISHCIMAYDTWGVTAGASLLAVDNKMSNMYSAGFELSDLEDTVTTILQNDTVQLPNGPYGIYLDCQNVLIDRCLLTGSQPISGFVSSINIQGCTLQGTVTLGGSAFIQGNYIIGGIIQGNGLAGTLINNFIEGGTPDLNLNNTGFGIWAGGMTEHTLISHNVITGCLTGITVGTNTAVIGNTVTNCSTASIAFSGGDSVLNNAVANCTGVFRGNPSAFGYNDFFNSPNFTGVPVGTGNPVTVNTRGDSADAYYDIFVNPEFVNPDSGNYHIQGSSRLIDAGDPSLPKDPDSTIADIGAFYYPQSTGGKPDTAKPWRVQLTANAGGYTNGTNYLGINDSATDGFDASFDYPEPPQPAGKFVQLYFPHPEYSQPTGNNFARDIRGTHILTDSVIVWNFTVNTNIADSTIALTFSADTSLPSAYGVILYDLSTGSVKNLKKSGMNYSYISDSTGGKRMFEMVIGDTTSPAVVVVHPNGGEILRTATAYTIRWGVSDRVGIDSTTVSVSTDSGHTYARIATLYGDDSTYNWTPASLYISYGGSVRVTVTDSLGNVFTGGSGHLFTIVGDSLAAPASAGWNLIGMPLNPTNASVQSIFGGNRSQPYYVYSYSKQSGYVNPAALSEGQGYWLGLLSNETVAVNGLAVTDSSVVSLLSGFDIISDPLVVPVQAESLKFRSGALALPYDSAVARGWIAVGVQSYNNGSNSYQNVDTLQVWQGCWLGVLDSGIQMIVKPSAGGTAPFSKAHPRPKQITPDSWQVNVIATMGKSSDHSLVFGIEPDATDGFDVKYDQPKAPSPPGGNYVEAYFTQPNWAPILGDKFVTQINSIHTISWTFTVAPSQNSSVTLSWDMSLIKSTVPDSVPLYMKDQISGTVINMRTTGSYTYSATGTRQFSVNTNPLGVKTQASLPRQFALEQNYPNPFNPTSTIRYDLPKESFVRLTIYNVLGQEVRTLVNETEQAGFKSAVFDGSSLASGVYFYRIVAGAFTDVKKMILIK
jgi:hypothetical protein